MTPAVVDPRYCHIDPISYPISVIIGPGRAILDARAGLMLLTDRDRIPLLDPLAGAKWSRVRITRYLVLGVGAVGPK